MKKRKKKSVILSLLIGTIAGAALITGCSDKHKETLNNIDASEYVVLGKYKGIDLTDDYPLAEEKIKEQAIINNLEEKNGKYKIKADDYVELIYEGLLNGEDFVNSSGEYKGFIEDSALPEEINESLAGMKKGDKSTVEIRDKKDIENLTGQYEKGDVLAYRTEVAGIYTAPELTEELLEDTKAGMEASFEENKYDILGPKAWEKLLDSCRFDSYPTEILEEYERTYEENCLETQGVETIEEYLTASGITEDKYAEAKDEYAEYNAKNDILIRAMAEELNLSEDSDEYKEAYQAAIQDSDMSEDELIKEYGADKVKNTVFYNLIIKYLTDNAILTS